MTLRLQVELLNPLTVVDFLSVDLIVTKDNTFPDSLASLLEIDVQELVVLHIPE